MALTLGFTEVGKLMDLPHRQRYVADVDYQNAAAGLPTGALAGLSNVTEELGSSIIVALSGFRVVSAIL